MSFAGEVWTTLAAVDVSKNINKKGKMSYLSWAWAWGQLMNHYPESTFEFDPPIIDKLGTVEVWCRVTVADGEKRLTRAMWLPIMDNMNNSIVDPTSRQISDNRMRCLVKTIAMFGLGHYIYAGEDLPDEEVTLAASSLRYSELTKRLASTIDTIKSSIESGDYSAGHDAWNKLTDEDKGSLWVSPAKGGCFTTLERAAMKTQEFRDGASIKTEDAA